MYYVSPNRILVNNGLGVDFNIITFVRYIFQQRISYREFPNRFVGYKRWCFFRTLTTFTGAIPRQQLISL